MTDQLIPVTTTRINQVDTLTCDSRDLYLFLEVETRHNDWITRRIEKYGFVEGIDFIHYSNLSNPSDRTIHYKLSIDMAKQLAMVENNDKGAQIRRYFLECEKKARISAIESRSDNSQKELNARSAAVSYRMMARMKVYPAEMRAVFAARSVHVLTGEPLAALLPPVTNSRETWMSPTMLAKHFGVTSNAIGRALKKLHLHGENDPDHKWSQPLSDKSPHCNKQVTTFVYDPTVIIPALEAEFARRSISH